MSKFKNMFKIEENNGKISPYYKFGITMDSNDGDYIEGSRCFNVDEYNKLPEAFFLGVMYFSQGYSGKFSHGNDWGDYYGHHFGRNKHGFQKLAGVLERYGLMLYTDWGSCHSWTGIDAVYVDENRCNHKLSFPSVDDLFETEEEMIAAVNTALDEYNKEYRDE